MEEEKIYGGKVSHTGVWNFKDVYKFCYAWLTEEEGLDLQEEKYKEKWVGNKRDLEIKWKAWKKVTDYFKFVIKTEYEIQKLEEIEIEENGQKIKTNRGKIKLIIKGYLQRDYDGKFEGNWLRKFTRAIYEKWVIRSRIDQFEEKLFGDCDKFLEQVKAYLALEGKK